MSRIVSAGVVKDPTEQIQVVKLDIGSGDGNGRICRHCGKVITAGQRRKYCSQECRAVGKKETIRQWQKRHPENMLANTKKWEKNNPEKVKEAAQKRYEANPEKFREQRQMWLKNNREKNKENSRRWYRNNTDMARENYRRWYKNNPEKAMEINSRKREKLLIKSMEAAGK